MSTTFPNVYHLANRKMSLVLARGAIDSLKLDRQTVEYVLPGKSFAAVEWHIEGETDYHRIEAGQVTSEAADSSDYKLRGEVDRLAVEIGLELHESYADHHICFENTGDLPLTLDGLRLKLPCNTEFKWGEPAGEKVLAHAYVGGHGSHVIYNRCDGTGSQLVLFPQDDTSLEYFDLGESGDEAYDNAHNSVLAVYLLSAERRASHEAHRSKAPFIGSSQTLQPGEKKAYRFRYAVAEDRGEVRRAIRTHGLAHVDIIPGLTVAKDQQIRLAIHTDAGEPKLVYRETGKQLVADACRKTEEAGVTILDFKLDAYGEQLLDLVFDDGRYMTVTFFVNEDVETLIKKRAAFIAKHQVRDPKLWYDGLLCEVNNNTGVLLTPDEYDDIEGWRRYAVTCDDPGLAKPAFLSSKQTVWPEAAEVEALDYYLDHFVWGGLQMTTEELYPYGIYGIIDWHQLRESEDPDTAGQAHVWRIYDYPHIYLTYYNMYYVAEHYKSIPTAHPADLYLERAYRTALAMYTIPTEIASWSAFETGLYNELVIVDIIRALESKGRSHEALRLQRLWDRKAETFTSAKKDIFGSEYPFDTTGFESTQALANRAIELARACQTTDPHARERYLTPHDAERFMHVQAEANLATRGLFEPAYYWYGSDYRGNNYKYLLSYMAQMGGQALLEYALHNTPSYEEASEITRFAYGSLLSSWALLHRDGTASGGFEPLPYGRTWLGPKHEFGPWYYSCEIDLGFCGGLRGMATVIADDPLFGEVVYGGREDTVDDKLRVYAEDGVFDQVHVLTKHYRLSVTFDVLQVDPSLPITISEDRSEISIPLSTRTAKPVEAVEAEALYRIRLTGSCDHKQAIERTGEGFNLKIQIV